MTALSGKGGRVWGGFPPPSLLCGYPQRPGLVCKDEEYVSLYILCACNGISIHDVRHNMTDINAESIQNCITDIEPYRRFLFTYCVAKKLWIQ